MKNCFQKICSSQNPLEFKRFPLLGPLMLALSILLPGSALAGTTPQDQWLACNNALDGTLDLSARFERGFLILTQIRPSLVPVLKDIQAHLTTTQAEALDLANIIPISIDGIPRTTGILGMRGFTYLQREALVLGAVVGGVPFLTKQDVAELPDSIRAAAEILMTAQRSGSAVCIETAPRYHQDFPSELRGMVTDLRVEDSVVSLEVDGTNYSVSELSTVRLLPTISDGESILANVSEYLRPIAEKLVQAFNQGSLVSVAFDRIFGGQRGYVTQLRLEDKQLQFMFNGKTINASTVEEVKVLSNSEASIRDVTSTLLEIHGALDREAMTMPFNVFITASGETGSANLDRGLRILSRRQGIEVEFSSFERMSSPVQTSRLVEVSTQVQVRSLSALLMEHVADLSSVGLEPEYAMDWPNLRGRASIPIVQPTTQPRDSVAEFRSIPSEHVSPPSVQATTPQRNLVAIFWPEHLRQFTIVYEAAIAALVRGEDYVLSPHSGSGGFSAAFDESHFADLTQAFVSRFDAVPNVVAKLEYLFPGQLELSALDIRRYGILARYFRLVRNTAEGTKTSIVVLTPNGFLIRKEPDARSWWRRLLNQ